MRDRRNDMREMIKNYIIKFENSFFSRVVRRSLSIMIPLLLVGGLACAVRNFPIPAYQHMMLYGNLHPLYVFLTMIYNGTFGLFSVLLAVAIACSYAMERNEALESVILYVMVVVVAFGIQINIGTEKFDSAALGAKGCFAAMVVSYLACEIYMRLCRLHGLCLERYTAGMTGVCVPAIRAFFPVLIVTVISAGVNFGVGKLTGNYGAYRVFNQILYGLFQHISDHSNFLSGLMYTVAVHLMWFFGIHGSHVLESVAVHNFMVSRQEIFSKSFYDVFVAMGGCGTTICVLLALLLFFRKERTGKLAGLASFTVIFNMNEMLTFGIPIILNPILFIPFLMTPVISYCLAYAATALGIVPMVTHEVIWSTPVIFGGYLATGSVAGIVMQLVNIAVGTAIYVPFLRWNQRMEVTRAKEHVQVLVRELQEKEEQIETPVFLSRGDHIGTISRTLLMDLKQAIRNGDLYMLYQPQVYRDGTCIGAEALLRWKHPVYGMIYPPLIIYLAEAGQILPELEHFIIQRVVSDIAEVKRNYSSDFKVSVNLTAHSLLWEVETYIRKMLEKYEVDPRMLWIEITEQDILLQTDVVVRKLNEFKQQGHKLLIDDFGMGHTSLLYLQSEYFDVVKLDGSLTRSLLTSKTNQKIVRSIIELGDELGVKVIAEYVEDEAQKDLLEKLGCHCYQGYLYSKPVELEQFITYMTEKNQV